MAPKNDARTIPLLTSIYWHHLINMAPKYARRTIPRHTSIYRHQLILHIRGTDRSYPLTTRPVCCLGIAVNVRLLAS